MQEGQENQSSIGQNDQLANDERLRKEICALLEAQPNLDISKLEIRVENGEAILVGMVKNDDEKVLVEDLVASVQGVTDVQDALDVQSKISSDDELSMRDMGEGAPSAST